MKSEQKIFFFELTRDQMSAVLPAIEQAENAYDKNGEPGFVLCQITRENRDGGIIANGGYLPGELAKKINKIIAEYKQEIADNGI